MDCAHMKLTGICTTSEDGLRDGGRKPTLQRTAPIVLDETETEVNAELTNGESPKP